MELRIIDNQSFIVDRAGKRETIRTLAEVTAAAERTILENDAAIATLRRDAAEIQRAVESAIVAGSSAVTLRAELAATDAEIAGHGEAIFAAQASIQQAITLMDGHP